MLSYFGRESIEGFLFLFLRCLWVSTRHSYAIREYKIKLMCKLNEWELSVMDASLAISTFRENLDFGFPRLGDKHIIDWRLYTSTISCSEHSFNNSNNDNNNGDDNTSSRNTKNNTNSAG